MDNKSVLNIFEVILVTLALIQPKEIVWRSTESSVALEFPTILVFPALDGICAAKSVPLLGYDD